MWWCPFSSNSQPMASSFPSPLLNLPLSSSSLSNSTAVGAITTGVCWRSGGRRSRGRTVIANATEKEEQGKDSPAFNPFGFVTDNPSSRSAIQLPESPAEDGNVGQMLYRIEDKGKEYGSYIRSGEFVWFVRETGSPDSRRGTIIFLHGAPTQSYSYRVVMSQVLLAGALTVCRVSNQKPSRTYPPGGMSDVGFHCFAPDWIGFGFSEKPYSGYGFDYTEKEFHDEFDKLLDKLEVKSPFLLVVQGFLVGSFGLTWALKNPSRISKLAILNSPLTASSPVPGLFQKLRFGIYDIH
ncbi:hypothetical protein CK203_037101 [Vitis vinifera]|uniref:AB hydrolase-1 domain-containing protein n=1 Tax=Vitis vinifera TaxID=29760 RepID=A0A438I5R0_VITVI|nr:hypothetical protein CK203_037101 [Vitis vinifera]